MDELDDIAFSDDEAARWIEEQLDTAKPEDMEHEDDNYSARDVSRLST